MFSTACKATQDQNQDEPGFKYVKQVALALIKSEFHIAPAME